MKFPLVTRMTVPSFDGAGAGVGADEAAEGTLAVEWIVMMTSRSML